jgi:hypothetical protein
MLRAQRRPSWWGPLPLLFTPLAWAASPAGALSVHVNRPGITVSSTLYGALPPHPITVLRAATGSGG